VGCVLPSEGDGGGGGGNGRGSPKNHKVFSIVEILLIARTRTKLLNIKDKHIFYLVSFTISKLDQRICLVFAAEH